MVQGQHRARSVLTLLLYGTIFHMYYNMKLTKQEWWFAIFVLTFKNYFQYGDSQTYKIMNKDYLYCLNNNSSNLGTKYTNEDMVLHLTVVSLHESSLCCIILFNPKFSFAHCTDQETEEDSCYQ